MTEIGKRLSLMVEKNRLHHAFFMVGAGQESHTQKMELIKTLACQVFVKHEASIDTEKTMDRMNKQYHPDFLQISTHDQEIKIDQIQDLIGWIYRAPMESKQKFAVIEHAQRLNTTASNALLKTLEEPPSHATLILCAPSKDHVLQTLRSRMFLLQFPDSQNQNFEEEPSWFESVKQLVEKEKFEPKEVFEITQGMAKERGELVHFFYFLEKYLTQTLKYASNDKEFDKYSNLFDQACELEQKIYKRYGNIPLALDNFFLGWQSKCS